MAKQAEKVQDPFRFDTNGAAPTETQVAEAPAEPPRKAKVDDELAVMGRITRQLLKLAPAQLDRVGAWLADRFGPQDR